MITHLISLNENLSAQPFFNATHLNIYIFFILWKKNYISGIWLNFVTLVKQIIYQFKT